MGHVRRVMGVGIAAVCAATMGTVMAARVAGQPFIPEKNPEPTRIERPERIAKGAKVIAVKLHADWCAKCKAMGSVFEDLEKKFDGDPVLFVKMDLSDTRGSSQAEYLAAAMGIAKSWGALGAGEVTGEIVLIDGGTKRIVDRIGSEAGWEKAQEQLRKAIGK
ncbi:MAG TPA: thioredoxin family protein [Phycisphaerales bacterium]|nr:thioredoxin family protein [Phycisphaerales bacterium]